jgi:hypothetical protein
VQVAQSFPTAPQSAGVVPAWQVLFRMQPLQQLEPTHLPLFDSHAVLGGLFGLLQAPVALQRSSVQSLPSEQDLHAAPLAPHLAGLCAFPSVRQLFPSQQPLQRPFAMQLHWAAGPAPTQFSPAPQELFETPQTHFALTHWLATLLSHA